MKKEAHMTLANRLTVSRLVLIPFMVIIMYIPILNETSLSSFELNLSQFLVWLLFGIASFTDFLDGYIARKTKTVSNLGKFLDPLADKVLVMTALLYLMDLNKIGLWVVFVILFREFAITGLRMIIKDHVIMAAGFLGKLKTAFTMLMIGYFLLNELLLPAIIGDIMVIITVVLTIVSMIDYFIKQKNILTLIFKQNS
jgi:CDP-diacylglycerol---glycerol-3-phosphate 3-phosphatidyltransferase